MSLVVPKPRVAVAPQVALGLALAAVIASIEPFDRLFAVATLGIPAFRAVAIVGLAVAGGALGRRLGLRITPVAGRWRGDVVAGLAAAVLVALACAGIDWAFRAHLDPAYLELMTRSPALVRTGVFMMHAFNEEILYRLFAGSALAFVLDTLTRGRARQASLWAGFGLAQVLNVWINVAGAGPVGVAALTYDGLRFFAPGMVWAGLYMRRGFQAAEVGHVTTHLLFQPLAGLLLAS